MQHKLELIGERVITDLDSPEQKKRAKGKATAEWFSASAPLSDTHFAFACGPWWVILELDVVDGRLEPVRLDVRGYPNPDSPTVAPLSALRDLPFQSLVTQSRERYQEAVEEGRQAILARSRMDPDDRALAIREAERQIAAAKAARGPGGQPPLSAEELMKTAEIFKRASLSPRKRGDSRRKPPRKVVADELDLSLPAVDKRLAKARELGFLPPTRQGARTDLEGRR